MMARPTAVGPPVPPGAEQMMLLGGGRIWEQNVRPLLEMLALYAGSGGDPSEWESVERGLADTDADTLGGWYTHPIEGGAGRLVVVMARQPAEAAVVLRVWGTDPAGLSERIDTLFDIGTMYLLSAAG